MFLQPKRSKYKKIKKGKLKKFEFKTNKLNFGTIGLKAIEAGMISAKQLEAARQAITRKIQRKGKNIRVAIRPGLKTQSRGRVKAKPAQPGVLRGNKRSPRERLN